MPGDKSFASTRAEPLFGLSKVENIEYQWLISRSNGAEGQQLSRLRELEEKHRAALGSEKQARALLDNTTIMKVGDLTLLYYDEEEPSDISDRNLKLHRTWRSGALIGCFFVLSFLLLLFFIFLQRRE